MLSRLDQLQPERSEVYGYDKIQQLISFKRGKEQGGAITLPTRAQLFRYDALGNRISVQEEDGKTTNYRVNNVNEYTEITGSQAFTPQYDANGNMVKDDVHTYRYDYNNKLIQVDDRTATYLYDALGRRIRKTTAEGTVNFFYAGDDVIEEQDGVKASLATYLVGNGIDDLIKMNRNGSDYFYHTNHLGSVMAITDRSGEIVERYEYDPFGKVSFYNGSGTALMKSAIGNEVLFTGRSYNAESGLYDYRARTMNPNIGRFVQVDPLLYVDGMNALGYVNNNSIINKDVLGLESINVGGCSGNGGLNEICQRYPNLQMCKDACKQNPNLSWCKGNNNSGKKQGKPISIFRPELGNIGEKYNPNSIFFNLVQDYNQNWINTYSNLLSNNNSLLGYAANRWLSDLNMLNETNPYATFMSELSMAVGVNALVAVSVLGSVEAMGVIIAYSRFTLMPIGQMGYVPILF